MQPNKANMYQLITLLLCTLSINHASSGCSKGKGSEPEPVVVPAISIEDVTLFEGNAATTAFEFNVSIDKKTTKDVTVNYTISGGTAKAGEDYVAPTTQSITIPAGSTQQKLVIQIVGDDIKEGDDSFTLQLQSPVGGTLQKQSASGTIRNDDTRVAYTNAGYEAPTAYPNYTLAWKDDFDGPALNTTIWSHQNGDGCPNVCGWGNNELEYYTDRAENLYFQNGKLIIEARPESFQGKGYTSSKIITQGKKPIKFGRIDIRAILPKGKGIWPAFWLMPDKSVFGGWPKSGEIDLMEVVGHEPAKTHGTLHFGPGPGSTQISRNWSLPAKTFNDEFHVFSLEWKQDQIQWLVDGQVFSTVTKADLGANNYPFNEEFFVIFNLAVGGNWPGSPDANTYFPQWLIVDYIRVYQ
ncbi:family 16 glycosylhydrolase [Paraflavitalea sp. CAU 1676]|uniref:family 16 glycosylhydrolase n=1 Tax=Paraflavitalea sp. CAU 1676 TaxID=3032598 RepID=UPI0023DA0014|nr:family 16 glycosylhydrolase [Paraflavitalea sp. CAU 1676]MDF2188021.1 family 16 glycosylhydrolase [Paraflavitalea sp. CAU 1676]